MTNEERNRQINSAAAAQGFTPPTPPALGDSGLAEFDVNAYLEEFRPAKTFPVLLPNGKVLEFESFERTSDRKRWERGVANWYNSLPKIGTEAAKEWEITLKDGSIANVLPKDSTEATYAKMVADKCVKPKISIKAALAMNLAPDTMASIQRQIDEGNKAAYMLAMKTVLELQGKESGQTDSTGNG